jgi:hypothetical protein
MTNQEFHEQFPAAYEEGHLEAIGALMGWTAGKGERMPHMTEVLKEALEHATACAFNAGVRAGLASRTAVA